MNFAELMLFLPGVSMRDYGGLGGIKTVSLRGLATAHTGFFVEDIRLLNMQSGAVDLSLIPARLLRSVTFIQGQDFGTQSSAAAFSFAGNFSASIFGEQKEPLSVQASIISGSFGLVSPQVRVDKKVRNHHFFLYAEHTKQTGNFPFESRNGIITEQLIRENTDVNSLHTWAGYHYENKKLSAKLISNFVESERGLPPATIFYTSPPEQRLTNRDRSLQGSIRYKLSPRVNTQVGFKLDRSFLNFLDPSFLNSTGGINDTYTLQNAYGFLNINFALLPNFILFGSSDFTNQALESSRVSLGNPDRNQFQQVVGVKYHTKLVELELNALYTLATDYNSLLEVNRTQDFVAPALRATKVLLKKNVHYINITTTARQFFRMPGFNEMFFSAIPSVNLMPEEVSHLSLGAGFGSAVKKIKYTGQINAFYEETKNKIVFMPTQNLFIWNARNFGHVISRGLEFALQATYEVSNAAKVSLFSNGTLMQARDFTDPEARNFRHQLPYLPVFSGTFGGTVHWGNYQFFAAHQLSGGRYALPQNIQANYLPGFNQFDAGLTRFFTLGNYGASVRIDVLNLFDNQYFVINNFPMPGRHYRFTLNLNFN